MNKEELQTLTIEQLYGMTEQALKAVADEVLERDWEFYNQITNPDFPDDPNRRLVCNSYTKKD